MHVRCPVLCRVSAPLRLGLQFCSTGFKRLTKGICAFAGLGCLQPERSCGQRATCALLFPGRGRITRNRRSFQAGLAPQEFRFPVHWHPPQTWLPRRDQDQLTSQAGCDRRALLARTNAAASASRPPSLPQPNPGRPGYSQPRRHGGPIPARGKARSEPDFLVLPVARAWAVRACLARERLPPSCSLRPRNSVRRPLGQPRIPSTGFVAHCNAAPSHGDAFAH
jgi:hypothetical protein